MMYLGLIGLLMTGTVSSCTDDEDPIIEIPPVEDAFVEVDGGGSTYSNTVFLNLRSENNQVVVERKSWDLAFSSGSAFKVLINGTTGAMAYETEFTDFDEVDDAYIENLRTEGTLALSFTNLESILYVDDINNPLENGTVLGDIATSESAAKVFILSRGASGVDDLGWAKIKIFSNSGNYILQHAPVDSDDFSSLEVSKDSDYNLVYVSLDNGKVEVEPKKEDWDILWSAGTSSTPFPQATNGTLAYFFQDLVIHNIYGGVGAAEVLEETVSYDSFDESNLASLTFNTNNRLAIGSNWRGGGGPSSPPAVHEDRFYVIRDTQGNYYKLRFLSLTTGGERGRPQLEYSLVKSAS